MQYTYPSYYSSFHCTGSECPDTCCAGWNIDIDRKSLNNYREAARKSHKANPSSSFSRKLRHSIDFHHGTFCLSGRRCSFLDEQNLCEIYQNLGKDALCDTCRTYPRHQEEYGNLREISLSLSCPEAAKIILKNPGAPEFITRRTVRPCPDEEQVDETLLDFLLSGRKTVLELIWNPSVPADIQTAMALAFTHDLQRRIRLGTISQDSVSRLSYRYLAADAPIRFRALLQRKLAVYLTGSTKSNTNNRCINNRRNDSSHIDKSAWLSDCIRQFASLEPVAEQWPDLMLQLEQVVMSTEQSDLSLFFSQPLSQTEKNILTYFITVYYPGAVYDENVFGNMQLALISLLMIRLMAAFLSLSIDKAAYLYSREVENSDANLNALTDAFRTGNMFSFYTLLNLIAG